MIIIILINRTRVKYLGVFLVSGMMRKGLFNCIVIVKDVHGFVYIFVRITGYDIINNMAPGGK